MIDTVTLANIKDRKIQVLRNIILTLVILIPAIGFGQSQKTLSEILWSRVNSCYSMFEDMDDDGIPDFNKIDDSKNGYLKISGSWPTCGCSCSSEVGAFKNSSGSYIILQSDEVECCWERRISSNHDLIEILPDGFGINNFTSEPIKSDMDYSVFFLGIEIPRIGTDTKVKIELIPFGLFPKGVNLICFEYQQENHHKYLYGIRDVAKEMSDIETINYLLNGSFDKISPTDNLLISKEIGTDDSRFKSMEEMREYLIQLKNTYDLYCKLKTNELILGWNRNESKFYIKDEGEKIQQITFRDFLINNRYWSWMC
ncbi:hypothetical protein SAMN04488028_102365 [Reichenbachiella agariperforans]|uniref:Uncharacterized protein n=1 Tax=Reichenbachiella agariperforans TaxID=156994 RepID=A0A1M6NQW5_REIAG|nr:hypothetical protein [Reichenbachiella agariperforans]SHJ98109.1 hypothetical protein SAMN04488028_102365 [Reichenbachiella agariperforans]